MNVGASLVEGATREESMVVGMQTRSRMSAGEGAGGRWEGEWEEPFG